MASAARGVAVTFEGACNDSEKKKNFTSVKELLASGSWGGISLAGDVSENSVKLVVCVIVLGFWHPRSSVMRSRGHTYVLLLHHAWLPDSNFK